MPSAPHGAIAKIQSNYVWLLLSRTLVALLVPRHPPLHSYPSHRPLPLPNPMIPSEILEERLSDISLKRKPVPIERQQAWLDAGLLAIQTVVSSANAGNVQCKTALKEILLLLQK